MSLHGQLVGFIYCFSIKRLPVFSMKLLPDMGLLRNDRAYVFIRPQGHLTRPHALQRAVIMHVLDGIEPKMLNLPLHSMQ